MSSRSSGRRRTDCCPPTSVASPTASASWSSSARSMSARPSRRMRPESSRTPSPRSALPRPRPSRPDLCSSSDWTGARTGSVPWCRSPRRSPPASRRGSTRSAPALPPNSCPGSRKPTTIRSSARRSTVGSSRSSRTARSSEEQLRESLAALLGGNRRAVGRRGSRRDPARRNATRSRGAAGTTLRRT